MQDHSVVRLDVAHPGPGLHDRAGSLVTEQMGQGFVGALGTVDFSKLRAADIAVVDLHEHLSHLEPLRKSYFRYDQRLALLDEDRSLHGSGDRHGTHSK